MKCLCGYEKGASFNHETRKMEYVGDKPFILFDVKADTNLENNGVFTKQEVRFYACPNCGALKIDI